jgi:hypothetical protein
MFLKVCLVIHVLMILISLIGRDWGTASVLVSVLIAYVSVQKS